MPAYGDLGYKRGDFPESELAADEVLSLPMYPELKYSQIKYVAETINLFHSDCRGYDRKGF